MPIRRKPGVRGRSAATLAAALALGVAASLAAPERAAACTLTTTGRTSINADTGAFPELLSIYHLLGDPTLTLR
jgi:hypothetical protein